MTDIDERYQRGQIYCIRSPQTEMVYYGSTVQPLYKRFYFHNTDMKYGKYCSSQEILKFGDAYIEWVEDYPCNSRKELDRREGQIQRENKEICVNLSIAGRTQKEWRKEYYEANKPKLLEKKKEWYETNKDAVSTYNKKYQEDNKDKVLELGKKYRESNKDVRSAYNKEYYEANRDAINAKRRERSQAKKTTTASPDPSSSSPLPQQN